jgi:hypothetical protein
MSASKSSVYSNNDNQIFESLKNSAELSPSLKSIYSNSDSSSRSIFDTASLKSNSAFSFFNNITWKMWLLIIVILAILGFNIFSYLAIGTQDIVNVFNRFLSWTSNQFGPTLSNTAKQTVDISATGAHAGINAVAKTADKAINAISSTSTSTSTSTSSSVNPKEASTSQNPQQLSNQMLPQTEENSLSRALNDASSNSDVQADNSYSEIQMSKGSSKSGWCYIGEEKGIRSCMPVGPNDVCMSGDIFPTTEVCVNPNLRV